MELFVALVEKFWIPILATLATAIIKARLERRPKVIAYLSHASAVSLLGLVPPPAAQPAAPPVAQPAQPGPAPAQPAGGANQQAAAAQQAASAPAGNVGAQPPPVIHTHSIVLRNVGGMTAFNVRLGHYQLPPQSLLGYQISPTMAHTVLPVPTGGWEIVIPTLVPNELVQIAYVYAPNVTWQMIHSHFKSNDGAAATVNVLPVQIPSPAYLFFRQLFVYAGIFSLTYALFLAGQWLYMLQRGSG